MSTYLDGILKRIDQQKNKIPDYVLNGLIKSENEIREIIHQRWLLGLRPDGSIIGIYRSNSYFQEKKSRGLVPPNGEVNLIDTGALWKGIKVSPEGLGIEVYSTDSKYYDISEKYGDANFNLSKAEKEMLFDKIGSKILTQMASAVYK